MNEDEFTIEVSLEEILHNATCVFAALNILMLIDEAKSLSKAHGKILRRIHKAEAEWSRYLLAAAYRDACQNVMEFNTACIGHTLSDLVDCFVLMHRQNRELSLEGDKEELEECLAFIEELLALIDTSYERDGPVSESPRFPIITRERGNLAKEFTSIIVQEAKKGSSPSEAKKKMLETSAVFAKACNHLGCFCDAVAQRLKS
jgi:hypothetical protein